MFPWFLVYPTCGQWVPGVVYLCSSVYSSCIEPPGAPGASWSLLEHRGYNPFTYFTSKTRKLYLVGFFNFFSFFLILELLMCPDFYCFSLQCFTIYFKFPAFQLWTTIASNVGEITLWQVCLVLQSDTVTTHLIKTTDRMNNF